MAGPAAQGQSDNSMGLLWSVFAFFAFLYGIWHFYHASIVSGYLYLKEVEISAANSVTGGRYQKMLDDIRAVRPQSKDLKLSTVTQIGTDVGDLVKYPFVGFLFILTITVYFGNTTRVFKRIYSMKSLSELEAPNWPQILPVMGLDLIKQDIDKGPWAMAMTPMQFCKHYNLLQEVRPERMQGMSRSEWDRVDVVLKRGEANRVFIMQLGPLWHGPDKLPPYARALFAAFAARINADSAGTKLLQQLARSSKSSLDFKGVDELLKKHFNTKPVQKVVQRHAYVLTVMAAMLKGARDDGVQASADFLWLKPMDRRLWYTLNTVGRQTPFIEVAGIFAHWRAEQEAQKRLVVPMVDEATNAVQLALKDVLYKRDEE